jgi:hypothetical protein
MTLRNLLLTALCLLVSRADASDKPTEVPLHPEAGTYEVGAYRFVLSVVVTNEGQFTEVGSLFRDGLPIAGSDYYRLELPNGSFIWYPPRDGETSQGWTRIDPHMKHSRWSMALIEPAPAQTAKYLRTVMRDPILKDAPRAKPQPATEEKGPPRNQ